MTQDLLGHGPQSNLGEVGCYPHQNFSVWGDFFNFLFGQISINYHLYKKLLVFLWIPYAIVRNFEDESFPGASIQILDHVKRKRDFKQDLQTYNIFTDKNTMEQIDFTCKNQHNFSIVFITFYMF
jgi:hypothetical protein